MKTFGIVSALLAASAYVVDATPASLPRRDLADAGQDVTAGVFKLGDGVLNIPGDAISQAASGDIAGALSGAGSSAAKLAGDIPGDLANIGADAVGSAPSPKKSGA